MRTGRFKTIRLLFYIIIAIVFFVIPNVLGNTGVIAIGPVEMPISSFKGVLQVVPTIFCVCMVLIDVQKGTVVASILLGLYFIQMLLVVVVMHVYSAIPGAVNAILSMLMIGLISTSVKRIERDGITDKTTKLYNIKGFKEALGARISKKKHFYIMVVHLKNVSNVVCDLGYEYGEVLLVEIGRRLKALTDNKELVGKLDGHEFVLAIPHTYDPQTFADSIVKTIGQKLVVQNQGVSIDCYIPAYVGISEYLKDSDDIDELIRYAGVAMCYAMDSDTEKIRMYRTRLQIDLQRVAEIERLIKQSLADDSFRLAFQPIYEIDGMKLRGLEALLRLTLPNETRVRPGELIPVAENTNLILKMDEYIILKAMTLFRHIIRKMNKSVKFSINVSAKNISKVGFADKIGQIVEQTGFPIDRLEIDITENAFTDTSEQAIDNIRALKEMGALIALDDFGTGHTSLSKLLKLPVDVLKIDKSLIDDMEHNKVNQEFVDSIIYMGHLMGCEVVAEGVERDSQLEILREHKCDMLQGFVWGRAMEYEDVIGFCREQNKLNQPD